MAIFRPYHYGVYKWDDYLLDIQDTIDRGNVAQQQGIRLQKDALNIAREQVEELGKQTTYLHQIGQTLESGFEELRAEFQWGFTLMVDRMETQIEQLAQITAKLDAIHKTLQSPLLTQARELFELGQQHFRKGLLDKALDAYLKAEQKNEVDFPLQLQIGKLFLYGRDEDDNVINLAEAERHLLLAARYADAEKGTVPHRGRYCGEAYFHAAVAAYLKGESEQAAGHPDMKRECLERALKHLNKAELLWPRFTDIVYSQAKCNALLGHTREAVQKLEILADRDRRYCGKATHDRDFENLGTTIEALFTRATISPGPLAHLTQCRLEEVAEAISWARRSEPASEEHVATIKSIERELSKARESLPTLNVDIEGLSDKLTQMRIDLAEVTKRSFQSNIGSSQQAITTLESRRSQCVKSIEQLKQTMTHTSGAGMGCLFSIIFYLGGIMVGSLVGGLLQGWNHGSGIVIFVAFPISIVGALLGSKISRDSKNRPHKLQIEQDGRSIEECIRNLPSVRQRVQTFEQEKRNFEAWQASHPLP